MANTKKDFKNLMKNAQEQGWDVRQTRNNHLQWRAPNGEIIVSGSTESDARGLKNHIARMRRAGFKG